MQTLWNLRRNKAHFKELGHETEFTAKTPSTQRYASLSDPDADIRTL